MLSLSLSLNHAVIRPPSALKAAAVRDLMSCSKLAA